MKEDLFDLEGMETMLLKKHYSELTESERRIIAPHVSSESEYNDLRDTLLNVKKTFEQDKITLRPKVDMKEALLKRFDEVHKHRIGGNNKGNIRRFNFTSFTKYAGVAAMLMLAVFVIYTQYNSGTGKNKEVVDLQQPEKSKDKEMITSVPEESEDLRSSENSTSTPVYMNGTFGEQDAPRLTGTASGSSVKLDDSEKTVMEKELATTTTLRDETVLYTPIVGEEVDFIFSSGRGSLEPGVTTNMYDDWGGDNLSTQSYREKGKTSKEGQGVSKKENMNQGAVNRKNDDRSVAKKEIRLKLIYSDL